VPRSKTVGATAIWRNRHTLDRILSNDVSLTLASTDAIIPSPSPNGGLASSSNSNSNINDSKAESKDDSKSSSSGAGATAPVLSAIVGPVHLAEEKLDLTIGCRKVPQGSYLVGLFEMDTVARKLRFLARTEVCSESKAPIFDPPLMVSWKKGDAQRLKFNVYQVLFLPFTIFAVAYHNHTLPCHT
jgi:hypothetical protein